MYPKLTFRYDREADILHIDKCPPYPAQESEELGDDVVARLNPTTREVENLEVMFFSAGWRIYNVVGCVKDFLNTPPPRRAERPDGVPGAHFVTAQSPWCFFITRSVLDGRYSSCRP